MNRLPIDDLLPLLLETVDRSPSVVIQAPPGAGKTTRVPLALLTLPVLSNRKIIMMEPRRLAAVNAARWMAATLGEEVGRTVGYSIRFERKVSAATRIEVVTEGILSRRLQSDPLLEGVGAVIFDEFHERSLNADTALALCLDARQGLREDLRIIVMSATLDGGPVAQLLGDAPLLTSQGQSFPVEVRYLPREAAGNIVQVTAEAVRTALGETEGDILVFLPGGGEIRRCRRLLEGMAGLVPPPLVCPLYGDLPFADQERAIMPAGRRKVVLATNIAETSLTIQGVRVVIDAGFTRQLQFDPATGLDRLVTVRLSAASAAQRAGRAGRLGPGVCYRLWTEHTQRGLIPFSPPEIRSADLTGLALELALWGVREAASLRWLDPPPQAALSEGRRLLESLGALGRSGAITPHGKAMALLPLHPRLAHMLLIGKSRGLGALACDIAALLSERDIVRSVPVPGQTFASDSDMSDRVELLDSWRSGRPLPAGMEGADPQACRSVDRTARHLRQLLGVGEQRGAVSTPAIGRLLALAYPDRIARQREPGSDRYLLANGRGGSLSPRSAVRSREFIVAVVMEGGEAGDGLIHQASVLSLGEIREVCAASVIRQRMVAWDRGEGRVIAREEERLGALVLASTPATPTADELQGALLAGVKDAGLAALNWTDQAEQFLARARFIGRHGPAGAWPDLSGAHLAETLPDWLGPYLLGVRSLAALAGVDLLSPLKGLFSREQLKRIEEGAPTHLTVPSGSRLPLRYGGDDEPPVLEVKLQELFGLAETPAVAWGRVPVVLHLLSPARRPVQVTRDLRGFWNGAYREVRKELKGRYPKHPWPEDPWSAVPTRHVKNRAKG
ncbi:MAG: ATP-dependent helicase HrpB [Geobacteraceae bacterium]|nr:ATP-dependent helicase HrpB [Geobacteraceae bacterium]